MPPAAANIPRRVTGTPQPPLLPVSVAIPSNFTNRLPKSPKTTHWRPLARIAQWIRACGYAVMLEHDPGNRAAGFREKFMLKRGGETGLEGTRGLA
jgi:hypothetical protein